MTFSDNDLKIFKGLVSKKVVSFFGKTKKIEALIERLEAAEAGYDRQVSFCMCTRCPHHHMAWRKVAGKSSPDGSGR